MPLHSPAIFTPAIAQHPRGLSRTDSPRAMIRLERRDVTRPSQRGSSRPGLKGSALTSSGSATFTRATCSTSGFVDTSEQGAHRRALSQAVGRRHRSLGHKGADEARSIAIELDFDNSISASNTDLRTRLFLGAEGADPAQRERYGYVGTLDPVWSREVAVPQRAINRGPGQ